MRCRSIKDNAVPHESEDLFPAQPGKQPEPDKALDLLPGDHAQQRGLLCGRQRAFLGRLLPACLQLAARAA